MKNYEINYLKKRLEEEKDKMEEQIAAHKCILKKPISDGISELSVYDNHPADIGSEVYEQEKDYAIFGHQMERLADINEALEKIGTGNYGICDFCGREISFDRMDAYPTAKLCMECHSKGTIDVGERNNDRPIEEKKLKYPFGRSFTDNRDYAAYDGEDAWQDVQKYGSASGPQDISVNRLVKYTDSFLDREEENGVVEKTDKLSNRDLKEQLPEK